MGFWFTIVYQPISNIAFFAMDVFNTQNFVVGLIILIVVVKIILLPFSIKTARTQIKISSVSKELETLKKKNIDKKELAEKTMEVYRREGINPFSPFFLLLIQIPIFLGIFFFVRDIGDGVFSTTETLYSFITFDGAINLNFLTFNLSDNGNILLALLLLITQYYVIVFSQQGSKTEAGAKKLQHILKTVIPIMLSVFSLFFVSIIGFYWFMHNLLSILQELLFLKRIRKESQ